MPPRYRNVCWTLNNPTELPQFEPEKMNYLVYQEEIGVSGTAHLQGYCEFKNPTAMSTVKALLGGDTVHLEPRRGTAEEASNYCKKQDTRMPGSELFEEGTISQPAGKRNDLVAFKDDVLAGKRKRDLLDEHIKVLARYPKLYDTINSKRPEREAPVDVTLLIGETGLGKTRYVYDKYKDDEELYIQPLSNGTTWWDTYDGHKYVLLDDFAGAASHMTLTCLLRLLDRYSSLVPTKGSHTWFYPTHIYVTTNILPRDWYKWEKRESQYRALARRFARVLLFQEGQDMSEAPPTWWEENCPQGSAALFLN